MSKKLIFAAAAIFATLVVLLIVILTPNPLRNEIHIPESRFTFISDRQVTANIGTTSTTIQSGISNLSFQNNYLDSSSVVGMLQAAQRYPLTNVPFIGWVDGVRPPQATISPKQIEIVFHSTQDLDKDLQANPQLVAKKIYQINDLVVFFAGDFVTSESKLTLTIYVDPNNLAHSANINTKLSKLALESIFLNLQSGSMSSMGNPDEAFNKVYPSGSAPILFAQFKTSSLLKQASYLASLLKNKISQVHLVQQVYAVPQCQGNITCGTWEGVKKCIGGPTPGATCIDDGDCGGTGACITSSQTCNKSLTSSGSCSLTGSLNGCNSDNGCGGCTVSGTCSYVAGGTCTPNGSKPSEFGGAACCSGYFDGAQFACEPLPGPPASQCDTANGFNQCGGCINSCMLTTVKTCTTWISELCTSTGAPGGNGGVNGACGSCSGCYAPAADPPNGCALINGVCSKAGYCSVGSTNCAFNPNQPSGCTPEGVNRGYVNGRATGGSCCQGLQEGWNGTCGCIKSSSNCAAAINGLNSFIPSTDNFTVDVTTNPNSDGMGIGPQWTITSSNPSIISLSPTVNGVNAGAGSMAETATKQAVTNQKVTITASITSRECTRAADPACDVGVLCSASKDVYACSTEIPSAATGIKPSGTIQSTDPAISGNKVTITWNPVLIEGTIPVDQYNIQVFPQGTDCNDPDAFCGVVNTNSYQYTLPSSTDTFTVNVFGINTHSCDNNNIIGDVGTTDFKIASSVSGVFFIDNNAVCTSQPWSVDFNPNMASGRDPNYNFNGQSTPLIPVPGPPYFNPGDEQNGWFLYENKGAQQAGFRRNCAFAYASCGGAIHIGGVKIPTGWVTSGDMENTKGKYFTFGNIVGGTTFQSTVGIEDKSANTCNGAGMNFEVVCNYNEIRAQSGMLHKADGAKTLTADITGCQTVTLNVARANNCSQGVWGNIKLGGYTENGTTYGSGGAKATPPTGSATDRFGNTVPVTITGSLNNPVAYNNVAYNVTIPFWSPGGNNTVTIKPGVDATGKQLYCACNANGSDTTTCIKSGISSPQAGVNFFLTGTVPTEGWWQVMNGNVLAGNADTTKVGFQSLIPTTCLLAGCNPFVLTKNLAAGVDTAGIAFTGGSFIDTDPAAGASAAKIEDRPAQATAVGTSLTKREDYDYFRGLYGLSTTDFATANDFDGSSGRPNSVNATKPTQASLNSTPAYISSSDLTIGTPWAVNAGESYVIFVNGDLTVNQPITVAKGGFLAFIVSGNIDFGPTLGQAIVTSTTPVVEGVYIANGTLSTDPNVGAGTDLKFVGAGTFVGWSGVSLQRDLGNIDNSSNPAEYFIFRPDLVKDVPPEMTSANSNWQEVN